MTNLKRVAMYCIDNESHPAFKETDGVNCVECNGRVGVKRVSEERYRSLPSYSELRELRHKRKPKVTDEIGIVMTNPNKPPTVLLNGQKIEGVIELKYNYETKDEVSQGQHNFIVTYCDKETNTIRTVAINRVWEG